MRKAGSLDFAGQLLRTWESLPEFLKDDVPEGLLVGLGTAVPVALMPNQDPQEKAAAVLGGIGGGILFGGAARRIGAMAGKHLHPGDLEAGSWGANIGRALGREGLTDVAFDALGMEAAPKITGEHLGRAIGRGVGDEVGAIGGTIGALALAQNADRSPDPAPQPTLGEVAMATVPGAAIGLALSGFGAGAIDLAGTTRESIEQLEAEMLPHEREEWGKAKEVIHAYTKGDMARAREVLATTPWEAEVEEAMASGRWSNPRPSTDPQADLAAAVQQLRTRNAETAMARHAMTVGTEQLRQLAEQLPPEHLQAAQQMLGQHLTPEDQRVLAALGLGDLLHRRR